LGGSGSSVLVVSLGLGVLVCFTRVGFGWAGFGVAGRMGANGLGSLVEKPVSVLGFGMVLMVLDKV
jgi:hypothetical protein